MQRGVEMRKNIKIFLNVYMLILVVLAICGLWIDYPQTVRFVLWLALAVGAVIDVRFRFFR